MGVVSPGMTGSFARSHASCAIRPARTGLRCSSSTVFFPAMRERLGVRNRVGTPDLARRPRDCPDRPVVGRNGQSSAIAISARHGSGVARGAVRFGGACRVAKTHRSKRSRSSGRSRPWSVRNGRRTSVTRDRSIASGSPPRAGRSSPSETAGRSGSRHRRGSLDSQMRLIINSDA